MGPALSYDAESAGGGEGSSEAMCSTCRLLLGNRWHLTALRTARTRQAEPAGPFRGTNTGLARTPRLHPPHNVNEYPWDNHPWLYSSPNIYVDRSKSALALP